MKQGSRLFKDLFRKSETTIPDAVLNRTLCVVAIPATPPKTGKLNRPGLATCRGKSDQWNHPALITFQENGGSGHSTNLVIFLLKDAAVRALRSGRLDVQSQNYAAPLVPAIPTQAELNVELLTYKYVGNVLAGSRARGVLRQNMDYRPQALDQALNSVSAKSTEQYLSALTNFFNTITPSGIVIHHTALIPGKNALPRSEREVDKYHETRDFKIMCFGHIYHVGYHYLVLPNGRVQAGRPARCEGAHAVGYNSYLGISIVGDFDSQDNPEGTKGAIRPKKKQIAALVRLCRRLMNRYKIPLKRVVRHSDIANTRCPGDRFPFSAFLQQLRTSTGTGSMARNR